LRGSSAFIAGTSSVAALGFQEERLDNESLRRWRYPQLAAALTHLMKKAEFIFWLKVILL
jgi:hypothetical protein